MISIKKAAITDYKIIADIGRVSVGEAHKASAPQKEMQDFLDRNYNYDAIKAELQDERNLYYVLEYDDKQVGFSKVVLNSGQAGLGKNITLLDRIYLLGEYFGLGLGAALLNFNIEVAKKNNQSGIVLFTWIGNTRAIDFYLKAGFTIIGGGTFKLTNTHINDCHQMFLSLAQADTK